MRDRPVPGWTLVANHVPAWLGPISNGCTLIFECSPLDVRGTKSTRKGGDDPAFNGRFHVLRDGRPAVRPVQQVLATAGHVPALGKRLVEELADHVARRWREKTREAVLFACGEVNLVSGGGRSNARWDRDVIPASSVRGRRLVLNPAHTPSTLPAMRDKRAWLSGRGGWLFTTANVFPGWERSAHRAAAAWHDGEPSALESPQARAPEGGFAVHVVTVR